jgi:hypothetical protein
LTVVARFIPEHEYLGGADESGEASGEGDGVGDGDAVSGGETMEQLEAAALAQQQQMAIAEVVEENEIYEVGDGIFDMGDGGGEDTNIVDVEMEDMD